MFSLTSRPVNFDDVETEQNSSYKLKYMEWKDLVSGHKGIVVYDVYV